MSATEIVLFESSDGAVTLPVEVDPTGNDVWLTQAQMAVLFDTTKQNVSLHLGNCFKEGELDRFSVVKDSLTTASDGKRYRTKSYALDAITSVLRRYIVEGHAENERRLRELGQAVSILTRLPEGDVNTRQVLDIVRSYAPALDLLDDYDHQSVSRPEGKRDAHVITYDECREVISNMRFGDESDLFGAEKDDSFRASIGDIYAGFAGQDAYPSVEEKAANLLYFVVKNHSFLDGNKRIAAALFLYFLDRNGLLFDECGQKCLADEILVAVTIMIAESRPQEKEVMVSLVMQFLCG